MESKVMHSKFVYAYTLMINNELLYAILTALKQCLNTI